MSLMVHLWQSTVCVGIAALLALALRQASARVRHAIWLLASVKFFVPLSLFVVAGRQIGLLTSPLAIPEGSIAIRWLDRSLSLWNLDAVTGSNGPGLPFGMDRHGLLALALVWASGVAVLAAWRWKQWQDLLEVGTCRDRNRLRTGSGDPAARHSVVEAPATNRAPSVPVQR